MANFELYNKCEIKKNNVTEEAVKQILKESLSKYYESSKITINLSGVSVKGNLKSMWERAITNADAQIKIENKLLSYKVNGTSSLGGWPWVWFVLGLFTGVFLFWFLFDLIEYLIARDRPKKYFEDAFNSVKFAIETDYTTKDTVSDFEKIEKLSNLKDRGIITEEEFQLKKKELLGI